MLFHDLCLLFGVFFVSCQATCCQNMLTKILLSLSRFSSLEMLNMLSRYGLYVWFLISCNSLKVTLWRVVTYYSHTTLQKKLKQGCFPIHNTPWSLECDDLGQLPQVNIQGTQPCWQLVSDWGSTSWGPVTCLSPPPPPHPPSQRNTLHFSPFPGLTTVTNCHDTTTHKNQVSRFLSHVNCMLPDQLFLNLFLTVVFCFQNDVILQNIT